MQTALRKMGNSAGIILPKPVLVALGINVGQQIEIAVENGRIVATPVKQAVQEGWEESAAEIGGSPSTAEEQAWLDAGDDADDDWTW